MQLSYYDRIGSVKIQKLIHDFYIEIKKDELLSPMYQGDFDGAEERLFMFVIQYLGGPTMYNEHRGHPRLRQRHVNFPVTEQAKQNWLKNMDIALGKSEIGDSEKEYLKHYFQQTAEFLKNR